MDAERCVMVEASNHLAKSSSSLHSPVNIQTGLNDDCLQEIFGHLDTLTDFVNVAAVCQRFRQNAMHCYPLRFRRINISNDNRKSSVHPHSISSCLRIFGHLIKSIDLICNNFDFERDDDNRKEYNFIEPSKFRKIDLLKLISDYCGDNLVELQISEGTDVVFNISRSSQFQVLQRLLIIYTKNVRLAAFKELKCLKLIANDSVNFDCVDYQFPKLTAIQFHLIRVLDESLFIDFLTANPQIQNIRISGCQSLSSRILQNIENLQPNLQHLVYSTTPGDVGIEDNVLHLTKLANLKSLTVQGFHPIYNLINLLADREVPIEHLKISFSDAVKAMSSLTKLRSLFVRFCDKETAYYLINNMPALKEIDKIRVEHLWDVIEILRTSKQLTVIDFIVVNEVNVDVNRYNSILNLVKNRVKITVRTNGQLDVHQNILDLNAEWLLWKATNNDD
ncbi:uncharacterized protein LOC119082672 [Bradysia coprophila]|uniref:uncharacterized protein LOC119082672 n=1 Tax=Bradysia coprophila TaxID=38358 RepID=UPI00187D9D7D|nr:uncharacterized protein LOC119082672 [Bradysia coprophila]